ncbi:MAG TPA: amidase [Stellaceae bacterium]|nr:amidase [Stellaceae bacterium]
MRPGPPPSLAQIAGDLAAGRTSARALLDAACARHARWDGVLHAYRSWAGEAARDAAAAADAALAAGDPAGPLHGIPVSVKDLFGVAGLPTFAGTARRLPPAWESEGPIVAAIRRQGGVLVGKTHTTEFALSALGTNPYGAAPRNPWDARHHRSAGGSSSGAGVSLAEGSALIALGTDTMGSVRIPASVTGTVGVKTSIGRWPTAGVVPLSPTFDTVGLLARSVADAAYAFAALDAEAPRPPEASALVIGIADTAAWSACAPSIARVAKAALDEAARAGVRLRPAALPEADAAFDFVCDGTVAVAEFDAFLAAELPDWRALIQPATRALADRGAAASARAYLQDRARQRALCAAAAGRFDAAAVLAAPTVPLPPPRIDAPLPPGEARRLHLAMLRSSCVANCLGLCAVTLPVGLDDEGLPVGLELIGRYSDDARVIGAALALERILGTAADRLDVPPLLHGAPG